MVINMNRYVQNNFDFDTMDIIAVEREARRMRAEAAAQMARSLVAWVSHKFAALRPAHNHHAA
ncbi:RSP_7527 family protein [Roseicitreum antarcticum]|uniref:Uncharacterized protein n=1 Tax=Roseicitreum antarcticum TaxID=564137 RepID=A0A1H3BQ95_9RHOB|nr:hypothetical protein [Roseicitreum antarcticum]SDX44132.1 hypothetical protein SAMN04488238_108142 [Roseicitreum antarcticum]